MNATTQARLPKSIWLWCVPLPLLIHLGAKQLDGNGAFFARWIESELGFVENLTVLLLIPAALMAFTMALRFGRHFGAMYLMWYLGVAAVCFGFAGEEASWGQHWLGWASPEYFAEHNRQGETNFHNLNIHFGRVVKTILTLAIIVGGLILPWRRAPNSESLATFYDRVIPSFVCIPAALFVFGVRLIERFKTWFDLEWSILAVNLKELQELYIALFLFLYVLAMRAAERAHARA